MYYTVFNCRDGPAWYGVGLLIRWSYDLRGSNPRPGAIIYLFLDCDCSLILLGMHEPLRILLRESY